MKLGIVAVTFFGLLAPLAMAQLPPPPPEVIYGNVTGLNCQGASVPAFPGFTVYTFSFADAVKTAPGAAGGGPAGRPTFPNISLTKGLDDCTPLLFGAVAKGTRFPNVTLTVGLLGTTTTLLLVTLQDVFLTSESFTENGADGNVRDLDEVVTLAYSKITITHVPSGKSFGWDVDKGKPF